jgi:O-antigen/teichoic acid export membrane protein
MVWSLAGEAAPGISALVGVPFMVHRLGADRFGIFALAWALAGSVGLFDLGLGRALTKLMSDQLGRGRETATLLGTAMVLLLLAGLVAGLGLGLSAPSLANRVLAIAPANRAEAIASFRVLAISVPFIMMFAGVQGALGAYQKFDLINAVRIPMGALVFLAPVAILQYRSSLVAAVWVVVAVRMGGCVGLALLCLRAIPHLRSVRANRSAGRSLLSFGGWVMVSNVATPVLVYADRFIIGAMLSMAAVAWYATPLEIVARLAIIPAAVASVLFPEMTGDWLREPERVQRLLARGIQATFAAVVPATLVVVAFAGEGLRLWLGGEFAAHGALVLQSLAIGTMALSVCWMPFFLIQAADRPDVTARIRAAEVPLFILVMLIATHCWGLRGAAIARGITFGLDGLTMLITARIMMPQIDATFRHTCAMLAVGVLASLAVAMVPGGIAIKAMMVIAGTIVCTGGAWRFAISDEERFKLRGLIVGLSR